MEREVPRSRARAELDSGGLARREPSRGRIEPVNRDPVRARVSGQHPFPAGVDGCVVGVRAPGAGWIVRWVATYVYGHSNAPVLVDREHADEPVLMARNQQKAPV